MSAAATPGPDPIRVAVIGLGNMGRAMTARLLAAGQPVTVWNRSPGPAATARGRGARAAATPREAAAGATHVLVTLADEAALGAVAGGPDGVVAGLGAGAVLMAASTVSPATVATLAREAAQRETDTVDVGLLGNPAHAAGGELRLYLGGTEAAVRRVRPVAEVLGRDVRHVGPLGAGMRLKLVLNLVMGLEMQALAEAAALGRALGLAPADVLDVIGGSGFGSPVMAFKGRRMATGRYDDPDFRLALMAKDLRLARAEAVAAGVEAPMTAAAAATHGEAVARGRGELDCAAIAAAVAELSAAAA